MYLNDSILCVNNEELNCLLLSFTVAVYAQDDNSSAMWEHFI